MVDFKIGDKVMIGVYVIGEWKPMRTGIITEISNDRMLARVDIMSLHGGAPWVHWEQISHLRHFQGATL